MKHEVIVHVRSELRDRIDAIAAQRGHFSLDRLCDEVDHIRQVARNFDLVPLEQLASTLESALALDGHGAIVLSYLDLMREAVGCEETGFHVAPTFLAAASVRLSA